MGGQRGEEPVVDTDHVIGLAPGLWHSSGEDVNCHAPTSEVGRQPSEIDGSRPGCGLTRDWRLLSRGGQLEVLEGLKDLIFAEAVNKVVAHLPKSEATLRRDDGNGRPGEGLALMPGPEGLDGSLAAGIRKQREGKAQLFDHGRVPANGVHADADHPGAGRGDLVVPLSQADQLAVAVGSPVAPVEDEHNSRVELLR